MTKRSEFNSIPAVQVDIAQGKQNAKTTERNIAICKVAAVFLSALIMLGGAAGGGYLVVANLQTMTNIYFIAGALIALSGVTVGATLMRAAIMNARETLD